MQKKIEWRLDELPPLENPFIYKRILGKLIYLSKTRFDITFNVKCLSHFLENPTQAYLDIAHKLLRYMKNSPEQGIMINKKNSFELKVYCDAD